LFEGEKLYPNDRMITELIGDTYAIMKKKDKALVYYEKVKQMVKGEKHEEYFLNNINKKIAELN
jgi:hypothetical protein